MFLQNEVLAVYAETNNGEQHIKRIINNSDIKEIPEIEISHKQTKHKIKSIKKVKNEDVFDIAVEGNQNFFANNMLVHNCFEVGFIPVTDDGVCGAQMCNLSTINGAMVESLDDWLESAKAATIIGTLQAGFTDFNYLSKASRQLTEEESLIGVSLTGWFDNPNILLDEKNQYVVAKYIVKVNKDWANKIGINQAARTTLVKPEGSSSLVLGSSSGIHPHHAKKYFRRIQMNKLDEVYQYFQKHNPHMCEESVWSAGKTDDVVTFPIEVQDNAVIKDDLSAIDHLNHIRSVQENWVMPGSVDNNSKDVTHNVSCTVEVKEDEWPMVIDYLYENKLYFSAISLIPKAGDTIYQQPPLQRIKDENVETWNNIIGSYRPVDYSKLYEEDDNTKIAETVACGGGACEISF